MAALHLRIYEYTVMQVKRVPSFESDLAMAGLMEKKKMKKKVKELI